MLKISAALSHPQTNHLTNQNIQVMKRTNRVLLIRRNVRTVSHRLEHFECGVEGYHCLDPNASCQHGETMTFALTSSPTSTPTTVTDDHPSAYSMTFAPASSPTSTPNPATDDSDGFPVYSTENDDHPSASSATFAPTSNPTSTPNPTKDDSDSVQIFHGQRCVSLR